VPERVPAELAHDAACRRDEGHGVRVRSHRLDVGDLRQVEDLARPRIEGHVVEALAERRRERILEDGVEPLDAFERRLQAGDEELVVGRHGAIDAAVQRQPVLADAKPAGGDPRDEVAGRDRADEAGPERRAHAVAEGDERVERFAARAAAHQVLVDRLGLGGVGLVQPPREQCLDRHVAGAGRRAHDAALAPPSTQRRSRSRPRCRMTRTLPGESPISPAMASAGASS
jgi:hypothetical protein